MNLFNLLIPISLFTFTVAVFLSKNPVYGVLSFVVVVLHVVCILIVLDLEFLAYVLSIVYIGAIVVLFLFVIMMFYIHHFRLTRSTLRGCLEYFTLGWLATNFAYYIALFDINTYGDFTNLVFNTNFLTLVAWYLFNDGFILTILAALLMLVGIVGAIILTVKGENLTSNNIYARSFVTESIDKKKII